MLLYINVTQYASNNILDTGYFCTKKRDTWNTGLGKKIKEIHAILAIYI